MELRKHPKMAWQGRPNWPPHWSGPYGPDNPLPQGEVGVLIGVENSIVNPAGACCLLTIAHNDQEYVGTLYFDDEEFSHQISAILMGHIRDPISAIGRPRYWLTICRRLGLRPIRSQSIADEHTLYLVILLLRSTAKFDRPRAGYRFGSFPPGAFAHTQSKFCH
jgi:hypothetical protein